MSISVTIFTDASFDPKTKSAGWGCWIKTTGASSVMKGGKINHPCRDSSEAELCAIANGIAVARACGWLRGAEVMIQSDSLDALSTVRKALKCEDRPADKGLPVPKRRKEFRTGTTDVIDFILATVADEQAVVATRHVRGHQTGSGRAWVNREVDRLANKGRKSSHSKKETA